MSEELKEDCTAWVLPKRHSIGCSCGATEWNNLENTITRLQDSLKIIPKIKEEYLLLKAKLEILEKFAKDCRDDFDCDSDAHKYHTTCRSCEAKRLLANISENSIIYQESEKERHKKFFDEYFAKAFPQETLMQS